MERDRYFVMLFFLRFFSAYFALCSQLNNITLSQLQPKISRSPLQTHQNQREKNKIFWKSITKRNGNFFFQLAVIHLNFFHLRYSSVKMLVFYSFHFALFLSFLLSWVWAEVEKLRLCAIDSARLYLTDEKLSLSHNSREGNDWKNEKINLFTFFYHHSSDTIYDIKFCVYENFSKISIKLVSLKYIFPYIIFFMFIQLKLVDSDSSWRDEMRKNVYVVENENYFPTFFSLFSHFLLLFISHISLGSHFSEKAAQCCAVVGIQIVQSLLL